jgi:eukaryotic-like serine/threonine-protein kinase
MIGEVFGNYRVSELIGEGGMGVVYLAEHPGIGRRAAIKILRPGLTDNPEMTKRFFNEARAANAIRHPGIVEVYDCGTLASGTSYIVMELLEGENLAARLRRLGRLPAPEARRIAAQTASALAAAHAAGIVHRDLKPDNLYLVPDERDAALELVKVLDFGIAKLGQQASNTSSVRTRTGSVMGTPAYMSPEQCRGTREIDHRTDIYALGVIMFEMLCGRPPFVSEGFGEIIHLHISAPPPSPRTINAAVPEDLERLILWCLAKEPAERAQTMADVHGALTGRPTPPSARPTAKTRAPAPTAPPANPTTFTQAAQASVLGTDVVTRSPGRKTPAIVMGVLAIGGVALWATRGSWMPRPSETVTVAPATSAPAKTEPVTPPTPAPAKVPPSVTAAIVSDPPGARVVRENDGAVIGMTPFRESWPGGDGVRKLRLELDGYRPEPIVVPLDRGVDLSFALRKVAQPEPHKAKDKHRDAKPAAARPAAKVPAAPTPAPAPAPKAPARSEPVPL